ncbi:acyltransferase [Pseudovibrio japonicus]|uniref:Acyltransferase n=1 Tax=Pseudovibrio japonicus TaxID=366534 RepID=A0ABQ3EMS3_9HYPH|nr:acyltransferase family protein [Pseudovibrio japonicus]GHB36022.1 acyltransferase [Pseudovibrio japonicus]
MTSTKNQRLGYRPDIEGLRGLAVAFVVLFHFNLPGVAGGFIGVDIFFVLSGFLMTQIVLGRQFDWSLHGVGRFYRKRFWRIAPAYYVVLAALALLFLSYPSEFLLYDFPVSFLYASLFSYNIYAPSSGAGYFDIAAIEKPVLHLWSLGVEVQFYLLWPLLLFIISKRSLLFKVSVIGSVALVSFISAVILAVHDPEVAYFSILTRLWQFCVGGLIAIVSQEKDVRQSSISSNLVSAFGILTLAVCAFYAPQAGWPGFVALVPTLATAVLLWQGVAGNKVTAYSLELSPVRALGRISYSLYLVHWPIVVLMHIMDPMRESLFVRAHMGVALSLLLACLLYWLVEKPFRVCGRQPVPVHKRWLTAMTALTVLFSLVVINNSQLLRAFIPDNVLEMTLQLQQDHSFEEDHCRQLSGPQRTFTCDVGFEEAKPSLFVWGDSHARVLGLGMSEAFEAAKLRAVVFQTPACGPYLYNYKNSAAKCAHFNRETVGRQLGRFPEAKTVVIAARWHSLLNLTRAGEETDVSAAQSSILPAEVVHLEESLQFLGRLGKSVVIATQVPEAVSPQRLKPCRILYLYRDREVYEPACKFREMDDLDRQFRLDRTLQMVADKYDFVELADLKSVLCEGQNCQMADAGGFYYVDNNHLSVTGASKVVRELFLGSP